MSSVFFNGKLYYTIIIVKTASACNNSIAFYLYYFAK